MKMLTLKKLPNYVLFNFSNEWPIKILRLGGLFQSSTGYNNDGQIVACELYVARIIDACGSRLILYD